MATLNEHASVSAAILSDISDDKFYLYTVSEQSQQQIRKKWQKEYFKTNKTLKEITICLQTNTRVTWLKLMGSKFFYDTKKWERSRRNKSFSYGSFPRIRIDPRALLNETHPRSPFIPCGQETDQTYYTAPTARTGLSYPKKFTSIYDKFHTCKFT